MNNRTEVFKPLKKTKGELELSNFGHLRYAETKKLVKCYSDKATGYISARLAIKRLGGKMVTIHIHNEVIREFYPKSKLPKGRYVIHHVGSKYNDGIDWLEVLDVKEHRKRHKEIDHYQLNNVCMIFDAVTEKYIGEYYDWYEAVRMFKLKITPLKLLRKARKGEIIKSMNGGTFFLEPLPLVTVTKIVKGETYEK